MWRGNGTTANVGLVIYGSNGSTGDISLTDPQLEKVFFSRGSINNFTLCMQEPLGSVERIRIWHDNSGRNPAWFLMQVLVIELVTEEKAHFVANRYLTALSFFFLTLITLFLRSRIHEVKRSSPHRTIFFSASSSHCMLNITKCLPNIFFF